MSRAGCTLLDMSGRRALLSIYALSGAAALIYEVCWTRLLTLHMGHTVASVSTVLAAFMGGLAAGASLAGRLSARVNPQSALRAYAGLEIGIGGFALVLPYLLAACDPILAGAYANGDGGVTFGLARVVSSLLLLLAPCALMGATFPMAARWFMRDVARAGADAGSLYAANTVGATLGAVAAGFWLIPALGLRGTTWIAIALNIVAAVAAWLVAGSLGAVRHGLVGPPRTTVTRHAGDETSDARRKARNKAAAVPAPVVPHPWLATVAIATSGFVALVDEVSWTRVLALVVGPTTYAFSAMLAAFIAGIAVGSTLGSRIAARARQPIIWLAACLACAAIGSVAAASVVDDGLIFVGDRIASPDVQFGSVVLLQSTVVAVLLLPLTLALGAAFPFAVATTARRPDGLAGDVADVYTANTLGAIAGSFAGGFGLIPLLGLSTTLRIAGALAIVGAGGSLLAAGMSRRTRLTAVAVSVACLTAVTLIPSWDTELLSSGAYKYAPYLRGTDLKSALKVGALLYYDEGAVATVTVKEAGGAVSLAIDGKVDASNAGDMLTQKLLAHVPLLLHPHPKEICIIGLGSGVTAAAALSHAVSRLDVLEISPEVVEASSYFSRENHDVLKDPRVHLIVGDGRTHLLLAPRQYDVIVSEPSNPWMAGVASLFTAEFFRAARARLAPGGILCQWAHTYDISEQDLRSIAATFRTVFPDGTMWLIGAGDLLLVGSDRPLEGALNQIGSRWERPGVAADLREVGATEPFGLYAMHLAGPQGLTRFSRPSNATIPIQTDDRLSLEFSAPRSIYGRSSNRTLDLLRQIGKDTPVPTVIDEARRSRNPRSWRDLGTMLLRAEAYDSAVDALRRSAGLDPGDRDTLASLTRAAAAVNRLDEVQRLLEQMATDQPDNTPVRVELSRLLSSRGQYDRGVQFAEEARRIAPADPLAREQLASIYADISDLGRLRPLVEEMNRLATDRDDTVYYTGALAFLSGQPAAAVDPAARLAARNPRHARAYNLLGACYASLGQTDQARQAFQASIQADPRDPAAYANLGVFELQAGNPTSAAEYFAEALTIDPRSQVARVGLADALDRQGARDRASRLRSREPSP
ncbi:MAG: fused MFS/spermidine synthase [Acidobacteria bacterium]|nr:fused MFS/spermidine synthase [Acidobacteriota bacterium]